MEVIKTKYWM